MNIHEFCVKNNKEEFIEFLTDRSLATEIDYNSKIDVSWTCKNGHIFSKSPWAVFVHKRFCPYCAGKAVYPGESLEDKYCDVALEWDYNKNGDLKPSNVLPYSNKKVWWRCKAGHSWEAVINNRTSKGSECPYCNAGTQSSFMEQAVYSIIHDVYSEAISREKLWGFEYDVVIPNLLCLEYNGRMYHSEAKNPGINARDKLKEYEAQKNGYIFISISETYGGKKLDIIDNKIYFNANVDKLKAIKIIAKALNTIFRKLGMTELNEDNIDLTYLKHAVCRKNEEESLKLVKTEIASEWNYSKNGILKPEQFKPASNVKVWWKCSTCGYEWITSIAHRVIDKTGCPACLTRSGSGSGSHLVLIGINDLKTLRPDLFNQIDLDKNSNIDIDKLSIKSNKKVWWKCSKCGGSWQAPVSRRVGYGTGCPYCSNRKVLTGFNDLRTINKFLADEFDAADNDNKATEQMAFTNKVVAWKCNCCGEIWHAKVYDRIRGSGKCPICYC